MLTHEQLKCAAVYLCKIRGIHPENQEFLKPEPAHGVAVYTTAWENCAREINAHEILAEAIEYGRNL